MSTRYVITTCCAAPVKLTEPRNDALACRAVCTRCGREVGSPGVEDGTEVERFIRDYRAAELSWLLRNAELYGGRVIFS